MSQSYVSIDSKSALLQDVALASLHGLYNRLSLILHAAPKLEDGSWHVGFDGEHCPKYCPVECREDERHCNFQIDTNGCAEEATCMRECEKKYDGTWCPINCPITCDPTKETQCPTYIDSDGCKTEETCVPKGTECPTPPTDWILVE